MKASPDRKNNFTGKSATKPDAIKNPVLNDVDKKYRTLVDKAPVGVSVKNLETQLKVSEEQYRAFYENSLDAILISSQDGSVHSANHAACDMLGHTENEICNLGRNGIVQQSDHLVKSLRELKRTGKFFGESIFIKKDKTTFPVELSSFFFTGYDGKVLTAIIFRDISVRKNIELYLQKSETSYRNLFENSPIGIAITNKEGKLLQANLPFARMYGYSDPDQMSSEVKNVRELYFNSSNRSIWSNNRKFHLPC